MTGSGHVSTCGPWAFPQFGHFQPSGIILILLTHTNPPADATR